MIRLLETLGAIVITMLAAFGGIFALLLVLAFELYKEVERIWFD